MKAFLFMTLFLLCSNSNAETKVAVAKLLKGDVEVLTIGKTSKLKQDDWVESGAVVKTAEKSFVKLVFTDKSHMNIGPKSEMKIENFSDKDAGVIDLVKGQIRSQVTKDYLQMDKTKSKMLIKTPNAVMGIRGTDFMISTNGKNTSAVLFEGSVVFNHLSDSSITSSSRLEEIVDRGVPIQPGEFSVVSEGRNIPTVPAVLNLEQREKLEKSDGTETERSPGNATTSAPAKSVVPTGLSGEVVSNSSEVLKNEVAQATAATGEAKSTTDAAGYVSGDKIKPTNGSFLHVESGVIIPPAADSVLDPNTNTYITSQSSGSVDSNGNYVPPKNVEITSSGEMVVKMIDSSGKPTTVTLTPPPPVKSDTPLVSNSAVPAVAVGGNVLAVNQGSGPVPPKNDIIGAFTPGGPLGFPGATVGSPLNNNQNDIKFTNQQETSSTAGPTNVTITVKP